MKLSYFFALVTLGTITFVSCKKDSPVAPAVAGVSGLNCSGATYSATANPGAAYNGTATVPYTGGNATAYAAGTAITSTGVTGLTATLSAGTLASGAGNLTYTITGTPASAGTASFALSFGGQTCAMTLKVLPLFMNTSATEKWYVENEVDSAFCCITALRNGTPLTAYPDSNQTFAGSIPNAADYMQFQSNNAYTWYLYGASPLTVTGTYTYGYSSTSVADTITANFQYNGSPYTYKYRINNITPTTMELRNRSYYYPSAGYGIVNGDTLLYRYVYSMRRQ